MDTICQAEAEGASLVGAKALLALSDSTAAGRFDLTGATWVRPDGAQLWEEASDLATEPPLTPIFVQSDGTGVRSAVWTGAIDTGTPSDTIVNRNCLDWVATGNATRAMIGSSSKTGHDFFDTFGQAGTGCANGNARIFCLEE